MLCHAYGWTPGQVAELTPVQTAYFLRHLPDVALRSAYQIASLEAAVRNAMGGKLDPNDQDAKPMPPERAYTPSELLAWFARPAWLEDRADGIPEDAAKDFVAGMKAKLIPPWVLQVAPLDAIKRAAG